MRDTSSAERGTPGYIIQAARAVMGDIDLDPASTAEANETVKAATFYTKEDNGLAKPWFGNVWLNPPFSVPLAEQFADKAIHEIEAGHVLRMTILVNYSTGRWFHKLLAYPGFSVGFIRHHPRHPNGRLEFYALRGNGRRMGNNGTGQVVFYCGTNPIDFLAYFGQYCTIVRT
jgi:ParB family transcriptional regulator, chromosome partitioning protein